MCFVVDWIPAGISMSEKIEITSKARRLKDKNFKKKVFLSMMTIKKSINC